MTHAPAEVYESALRGGSLYLRGEDGARQPVPVGRWLGPLGRADAHALKRAVGPVLDVGCGPGRHVLALARRGVLALGVDAAPAAVDHARGRGASVLLGSVFASVPGAGHWQTALLMDGNIGIGGKPVALLERLRSLLAPEGSVLCEVGPPGSPTMAELISLETSGGARSKWFAWARVSVDGLPPLARRAGMAAEEIWQDDERWFAVLTPAHQIVPNSSWTASA